MRFVSFNDYRIGVVTSDLNRPTDMDSDGPGLGNSIPILLPCGVNEDDIIDALLAADGLFPDFMFYYRPFARPPLDPRIKEYPDDNYNSNSWVKGLMDAVLPSRGVSIPTPTDSVVGWNKPVRPYWFGPRRGAIDTFGR